MIVIKSPIGAASVAPHWNLIKRSNSTIIGRQAIIHINRFVGTFIFSLLNYLCITVPVSPAIRSEEHTSELQSRFDLVCRLLLEKKKQIKIYNKLYGTN